MTPIVTLNFDLSTLSGNDLGCIRDVAAEMASVTPCLAAWMTVVFNREVQRRAEGTADPFPMPLGGETWEDSDLADAALGLHGMMVVDPALVTDGFQRVVRAVHLAMMHVLGLRLTMGRDRATLAAATTPHHLN